MASRLWCWEHGIEKLGRRDIVVVDEAGMLGSVQMGQIISHVHDALAKLVLVGDPEQLQAIQAGGAYRAIADRCGFNLMSEIHRQKAPWQKQATIDFAEQRTHDGLLAYAKKDHVHYFPTRALAIRGVLEQWDETRSQTPEQSQIMLAYTRDEVQQLNEQARQMRHAQGELGVDVVCETAKGKRHFATGDRIYFLKNDRRDLNVKNGTLGTIETIEANNISVRLDPDRNGDRRVVAFQLSDYNHLDHGYAATVYKAQGVTVDRAHVLASRYFDRHSTYVAMSRHREGVELYVNQAEFPSFTLLSKNLSRDRSKDISLDYAQHRGVEIDESKRLSDRETSLADLYSRTLTPERLAAAEARLDARAKAREKRLMIEQAEKKVGRSFDFQISKGDRGVYLGLVEIGDQRYGALSQPAGVAKLIPESYLDSKAIGKRMEITTHFNKQNQIALWAIQPELRAQYERTLDIQKIEKAYGNIPVDFRLQAGDRGIYRCISKIGEERYGVMQQEDRVKAIPESCLLSRKENKPMVIEERYNDAGDRTLVAVQPKTLEMEQQLSEQSVEKTKKIDLDRDRGFER